MNHCEALEGSPQPMGISFMAKQQAWNFALYSKHAPAGSKCSVQKVCTFLQFGEIMESTG